MKGILLTVTAFIIALIGTHVIAAGKTINCPALKASHYGQNSYYDPKIGRVWYLNWSNRRTPVWSQVSIPQTTTCGTGKSSNGIPLKFQCAVFQCKSDAVVAVMGQNHQGVKCFSAYVSTRNTFYCDSFSMN